MKFSHVNTESRYHQLPSCFFHPQLPQPLKAPKLRHVNTTLAEKLGFTGDDINTPEFLALVSGQQSLSAATPLAMKYTGHQFGTYNPELGDGRGLLIAELTTNSEEVFDLHLKGAGKTPFSRFGDGRAVLRSTIREYLASEAMNALNIPTTRALSLVSSEQKVQRESVETTAMLVRVTPCHIRFGHFEYCFYTKQHDALKTLADYVITQYFPQCAEAENPYLDMLDNIIQRTAKLIAHWQAAGFCHGVMNTDNMSIIGETFDYGPYAFLDDYNPSFICNHSDYTGRYAFDQQPTIAQWNLSALAYALTPLIDRDHLNTILDTFMPSFTRYYYQLMAKKLGLPANIGNPQSDTNLCYRQLIDSLLDALQKRSVDYSQFFGELSHIPASSLSQSPALTANQHAPVREWLNTYRTFISKAEIDEQQRLSLMQQSNPVYTLRNHYAQQAIAAAELGDYSLFEQLLSAVTQPFTPQAQLAQFATPPDEEHKGIALSCSS